MSGEGPSGAPSPPGRLGKRSRACSAQCTIPRRTRATCPHHDRQDRAPASDPASGAARCRRPVRAAPMQWRCLRSTPSLPRTASGTASSK
ncbi:hypothetical protein ACFPM0_21450 [Pseudonocardia sulfidoxydans]|uniref:hypothetical protein n=1 Tax=Pseudonocardia sulfidoxydans TaxID=54011 RepID=UPI00360E26AB